MAESTPKDTTNSDDLDRRVADAKATDQDALQAGQTDDTKSVGDGGVSVEVDQAAKSDAPAETKKPAARSRKRTAEAQEKAAEDAKPEDKSDDVPPGIDPETGFRKTSLASDDLSNSTLRQEGDENLEHDSIPDPYAHSDRPMDEADTTASGAIIAEQDPDVETNVGALGAQIAQFDPEAGVSVLSALANPPAAAVQAEGAVQANTDARNNVVAADKPVRQDANGDVDLDGAAKV